MFKKLLTVLSLSAMLFAQSHTVPTLDRNNTWTGTNVFKTLNNIPHCENYGTAGVTPFQTLMASCVAAGTIVGIVDATNVTDTTNRTMTANWTYNTPGVVILFPKYQILMGTNRIIVPAGTNNIYFKGVAPWATLPLGTVNGTIFKYTGSGTAISLGDSSNTSHGHVIEDIACDLTGASGSAHCFDSTRVFTAEFNRVRGLCPIGADAMTFINQNGTSTAPGGQSTTFRGIAESNCQFGVTVTGGTSPPLCNNNQFIGGQFSGDSAAGSIAIDIECGNDNTFSGPYIGGYDIGLKVNSPSARAAHGDIHMESCGTYGIQFTSVANNNHLFTDSGCTMQDLGVSPGQNTIHDPAYAAGVDYSYGSITALGTTQANLFYSPLNFRGNAGLPTAVNGGTGGYIGIGSSTLGFWIGDGTGQNADFYKRTGGVSTLIYQIHDDGTVLKYKGISTVSNGQPAIYGQINSLSNSASTGATTIYAVPSAGVGLYRVSYYFATQAVGTGGTATMSLIWSDGLNTKTFTTSTVDLTTNGITSVQQGSYVLRANNSTNIQYSATVAGAAGSPTYMVFIRVEAL